MQDEKLDATEETEDRFHTDPSGLPAATRPALLELADGEVLDLSIGPVANRLEGTTVRPILESPSQRQESSDRL
jgi:hypothetical protein